MKLACLVLSLIIMVAITAICVMVKFAKEFHPEVPENQQLMDGPEIHMHGKNLGVISLHDNMTKNMQIAERFPYVVAIMWNSSTTWTFTCFGSMILVKWVLTSAHCRRPGFTHRALLYHDFARNKTQTYPVAVWRIHERYSEDNVIPKYDIAVAKLTFTVYSLTMKPAGFSNIECKEVEASVWKTVSTMDNKMYLTNDFDAFAVQIANPMKCYESFGVPLDTSMICVDTSRYDDCFVHEFGPIFHGDEVVGIISIKPRDCDIKYSIFTNVSHFSNWILRSTKTINH